MKNRYLVFFILLLGCNKGEEKVISDVKQVKTLGEMVNEGLNSNIFYSSFSNKFPVETNAILFVIPNSSCFNCFEDLVKDLSIFYKKNSFKNIIVLKNDNIKEREVRFSLQDVTRMENIEILDIANNQLIVPHDFFPKLGFIRNGNLSCIEVFEQGNEKKIKDYFKFLNLMVVN